MTLWRPHVPLTLSLAWRLLWGSRSHPSTRMSTLLALGIMVAIAFSVVVVAMVNRGFSDDLGQAIDRVERMPTHAFVYAGKDAADTQRLGWALERLWNADVRREKLTQSPHIWSYRATPSMIMGAFEAEQFLKSPMNMVAFRRVKQSAMIAREKGQIDHRFESALWCSRPDFGPTGKNEVWASDPEEPLGRVWVMLWDKPKAVGGVVAVPNKRVVVTGHAPPQWRSSACTWWTSPAMAKVLFARGSQSPRLEWDQDREPRVLGLIDRWHRAYPNAALSAQANEKQLLVGRLERNQRFRRVQFMVSTVVIGVLGGVGIYQLGALLLMIGLHARRDVAQLRSLGFPLHRVLTTFLWVTLLLCGSGLTLGGALAWWWLPHMNDHLSWAMNVASVGEWFEAMPWGRDAGFVVRAWAIGLGASVLVSLYPAWTASRTPPSEIWREES